MFTKKHDITKFSFLLITTITFTILFLSCDEEEDISPSDFTVTVRDINSGSPVSDAQIIVDGETIGNTGSEGEIEFVKIPGEYEIEIYHDNFEFFVEMVEFPSKSGYPRVTLQLTPRPPKLDIDEKQLDFGDKKEALGITITNTGGGILDWEITENYSWLEVNKSSGELEGNASETLNVEIDR